MKVFIAATMTVDGFIGESTAHHTMDWRSKSDGRSFSRLVTWAGVMVMGSTTYNTFKVKRAPFGQRLIVYSHHPENVTPGENVEASNEVPRALVERLGAEGYKGLAICGGMQINTLFWEAGVVDELYLTVEPHVFGKGVPLLDTAVAARLELLDTTTHHDGAVRLHYAVVR